MPAPWHLTFQSLEPQELNFYCLSNNQSVAFCYSSTKQTKALGINSKERFLETTGSHGLEAHGNHAHCRLFEGLSVTPGPKHLPHPSQPADSAVPGYPGCHTTHAGSPASVVRHSTANHTAFVEKDGLGMCAPLGFLQESKYMNPGVIGFRK